MVEKRVESETQQGPVKETATQQTGAEENAPSLPPRPPPAAYPNGKRVSIQQPPIILAPPCEETYGYYDSETQVSYRNYSNPRWEKVKFGMYIASLATCVAIFAVAIKIGFHTAPYMTPYWYYPSEIELGVAGSAAGLAIIFIMFEFVRMCLGTAGRGMHPGLLVTFNLFIWGLALTAVIITTFYATQISEVRYEDYSYPNDSEGEELARKTHQLEKVLLGFECVLLALHFILFVAACTECHQHNRTKRKTVYITVPPSAPIPGQPGQEVIYQPVQYPAESYTIVQLPPTNGTQWTAPGRSILRASVAQPTQWAPPAAPVHEYEGFYAPQGPSSTLAAPPRSALKTRQMTSAAVVSPSGPASSPTQPPAATQPITAEPAADK
ncbi:hypothetical protein QBC38DRAFT_361500 [Podospora fimiseda]|uniref:MARVEL domain-containing protein n=1 Tax=Podospora fimiseda TaxID=252190 RepID=A0AAN7H0P7_9PEZI|nr:hypothetical protein QBC38DRAFT_361500 [Podospora fimiseda]